MAKPTPVQTLSLRLPRDLHRAAVERAEREQRSLAAVIRIAVEQYLNNDNER